MRGNKEAGRNEKERTQIIWSARYEIGTPIPVDQGSSISWCHYNTRGTERLKWCNRVEELEMRKGRNKRHPGCRSPVRSKSQLGHECKARSSNRILERLAVIKKTIPVTKTQFPTVLTRNEPTYSDSFATLRQSTSKLPLKRISRQGRSVNQGILA